MATILTMTAVANEQQTNEKNYYQTKQERKVKGEKFRTVVPETDPIRNTINLNQGNTMTNPLPAHPLVSKSQRSDGMPPKDTHNPQLSTSEKTQQNIQNELTLRHQNQLNNKNQARKTHNSTPTFKPL